MNKITYFGSEKDISEAIAALKTLKDLESMREPKARLLVQELIDKHRLKASILINGNTVWSRERILQNLERIIKNGALYNEDQRKPPILSHYFYQFLHLVCGSIAHNCIDGWVCRYPTINHLKKFFQCNEFGKPVRDWIPREYVDAKVIIEAIEAKLFPFQTYLKTRQNSGKRH